LYLIGFLITDKPRKHFIIPAYPDRDLIVLPANPLDLMKEKEALEIRTKLVDLCRKTQTKTVESAKQAMNEAQIALNEYGPNKDRYDSFRDQLISRRDMFAGQYQKALAELNVLDKIDVRDTRKTVEFGAIVVSNLCNLFIGISAGKLELDGETFHAISPAVPIFKAMEGLKKGEVFEFNGKKQTIKDLY
jgi:hypothetical protein